MSQDRPQLRLLGTRLAVCRLPVEAGYPDWARSEDLLALVRTARELSVVCAERFVPSAVKAEPGWRVLEIAGPLEFSLVGVLAGLANVLAAAAVAVFVISTFDTDYILVKEDALERATAALSNAGYEVEGRDGSETSHEK